MHSSRTTNDPLALGLASAFLGGAWTLRTLVQRGSAGLGHRPDWLRPLARRVVREFRRPPLNAHRALATFIAASPGFASRYGERPIPHIRLSVPFAPRMGRMRWSVPSLPTVGALIDWLGLTPSDLAWFADARGWERFALDEPLRHYRYRWIPKARGGLRLLEAPKPRLRALQRKVLHGILDRIPAHPAAAAFRPGGSVLAFAAPHRRKRLVLRLDLEDFFASVTAAQVRAIFGTAGYPEGVSRLLAAVCTNSIPRPVLDCAPTPPPERIHAHWRLKRRLSCAHLPQGAPTSPALANLCAFRLDARLGGLARAIEATYSRYADDLAFSGDAPFAARSLAAVRVVARIARDEGFALRRDKTRAMSQGVRQLLAGVVVNQGPNIVRSDYDALKAVLTNCARHGPSTQNREGLADFHAHLLGRLGWVHAIRPDRATRLRRIFDRIDWAR